MAEAVVAPAPAAVVGTTEKPNDLGQPITAGWRDSLPEAIRSEKTLEKFTDAGALAKSYIELEKMPRGVTAPKDGAPQAEWDAYYERLGRPKTADEYGVEAKVPDGLPWNKAAEKLALSKMHAAGLSTKQAKAVLDGYLEIAAQGNTTITQHQAKVRSDAETTMKNEWGGLADQNIALVQRAVQEFGGDEFRMYLDDSGLGNDPRFMRFVYNAARPMLEDGLIRGENLGMKKAEAAAEIQRLMADPGWAKGDKTVLQKINDLYPIAHGE